LIRLFRSAEHVENLIAANDDVGAKGVGVRKVNIAALDGVESVESKKMMLNSVRLVRTTSFGAKSAGQDINGPAFHDRRRVAPQHRQSSGRHLKEVRGRIIFCAAAKTKLG
jgi:hypothetical protein